MKVKRLLAVAAVAASMVFGSMNVFATELKGVGSTKEGERISPNTVITGETVPTPEEYEAYLQGLSAYDRQQIAAKEAAATRYAKRAISRSGTKISIPGTFTMYQQEEKSYCIPATLQSMLMYINGDSPDQSKIAEEVGTSSFKIPAYLNARQSFYYVYVSAPDQEEMCEKLYSTIAGSGMPASMGISGTTTKDWYYTTRGHSLVVNAIYDDYSKIQFGDPLGDYADGCPYFYEKDASTVSKYCTRIVY